MTSKFGGSWIGYQARVSTDTIAMHDLGDGQRLSSAQFDERIGGPAGALRHSFGVGRSGVPDQRRGETGAAWVVLAAGVTAGPDDILSWARDRLAAFKMPRDIRIVDELPRNATGKIMKTELCRRATDNGTAQWAAMRCHVWHCQPQQ